MCGLQTALLENFRERGDKRDRLMAGAVSNLCLGIYMAEAAAVSGVVTLLQIPRL
jgi:hypothetical protein